MENDFERILEVYSFEELLELNDYTYEEVVRLLFEHGLIELPEVIPIDTTVRH